VINAKSVTDVAAAIAAFEPDIAIALTAYNVLHGIWSAINPGKTEADYKAYLQSTSQTNVDTTAAYLTARGFIETPAGSGNWSKPAGL
jgi:hypothetical protein